MYAHNLYDPLQSAYRAKHATETAIIKLNNDIIGGMDEGKCTITSGVSRISFRGGGGGSECVWKSGGICMAPRVF